MASSTRTASSSPVGQEPATTSYWESRSAWSSRSSSKPSAEEDEESPRLAPACCMLLWPELRGEPSLVTPFEVSAAYILG